MFLNKIVNEEKNINEEIFRNYFKYQNPSSLGKDLFIKSNKLIKSMEDINIKKIPENENPEKRNQYC